MYPNGVPENILAGQKITIKYDCDGGSKYCGITKVVIYKVAKKNFEANDGKHICRICMLKLKNPMKNKETVDKIKKTNLERYGTTCSMNTQEHIDARREKMFGTQEAIDARNEKTKETNRKKYGVDHIMHTEEGKEKQRETMREKYGVDYPLQNEEIRNKTAQTCLGKYGYENPLSSPEIRQKGIETSLERYGVEHYSQLPEMREYFRKNCTTWLAESYANPWSAGITRPQEWTDKQSDTINLMIQNGTWKGGGKNSLKGVYTSDKCRKRVSIFRSSYELITHWHLDHNEEVEWYDYEPFQVKYYDTEGKKRDYTIDFIVKYRGVERLKAIEVKNNWSVMSEVTKKKYEGFMEACGKDMDHEFWFNKHIKMMNIGLKMVLDSGRVALWKRIEQ